MKNREFDSHISFYEIRNRKHSPDKLVKFRESNDIVLDPWPTFENKFYLSCSRNCDF